MSILDGFVKTKKYRKTSSGYKLQSEWTSSETVQYKNGLTLEESEVYLTQEEYDALGDEKLSNGVKYYITDADANPGQNSNRIIGKTFTKTIETMSTEPYGKLILVNEDISPYEIDGYEIKTIICTMKATTDISTHVFSLIATPYYEGNKLLITAFNGHGYNSTLCGILNFTVIYG